MTISQTPIPLSLKRKRDDTDENEQADESEQHEAVDIVVDNVIDLTGNDNNDKDIVLDDDEEDLLVVPLTKAEFLESGTRTNYRQLDGPPPRKRTRRIASVLAQTATAVTIGAVVTWSALAFS